MDLQCPQCKRYVDNHSKCNSRCYFEPSLGETVHAVLIHSVDGFISQKGDIDPVYCERCKTDTLVVETVDSMETLEYDDSVCDEDCVAHFLVFMWVKALFRSYVHMG